MCDATVLRLDEIDRVNLQRNLSLNSLVLLFDPRARLDPSRDTSHPALKARATSGDIHLVSLFTSTGSTAGNLFLPDATLRPRLPCFDHLDMDAPETTSTRTEATANLTGVEATEAPSRHPQFVFREMLADDDAPVPSYDQLEVCMLVCSPR